MLAAVHAIGGQDVRVFGSVARHQDRPNSDVDLLELSDLLTVPVAIGSAGSSGPVLTRALAEGVPL